MVFKSANVLIKDDVIKDLVANIDATEGLATLALAKAAAFATSAFMMSIPEEIKGKIRVGTSPVSESAYLVTVMHGTAEAATFALPKMGVATFLPSEKLGPTTRPMQLGKQGEQGIYVKGVTTAGRPSIMNYAENLINTIAPGIAEVTQSEMVNTVIESVHNYWEAHGVTVEERISGGRYRAPAGGVYDPSSLRFFGGGQFIAGGGIFNR
jgi:hypothetical protein